MIHEIANTLCARTPWRILLVLLVTSELGGCKIWHYDMVEITVRDARSMSPVHNVQVAIEHGGALTWEGKQARTDVDITDLHGTVDLQLARNAGDAYLFVNGERFMFTGENRLGKPAPIKAQGSSLFDLEIRLIGE